MQMVRIIFATALTAALVVGCAKEEDVPSTPNVPGVPATNALLALFDQHVQAATQQFTLNAATGGIVSGADGVTFFFPPNAFRTAAGAAVTGSVQVDLVEAMTVGDMLWLNKRTVGNDNGQLRPLVSGGQYFLDVTQGGQQLRLAENAGFVNVPAPNGVDPNMQLFSGTVDGNGIITWDPFGDPNEFQGDTLGYSFPNGSLGWVNCDYFMSQSPLTGVQVNCPAGHNGSNTVVWLVFPVQNSLTGLSSSGTSTFSTGSTYQLPVGLPVQVVALSNVGGSYSWAILSTTITMGMTVDLTFEPTTLEEFQQFAGSL